MRENKLSIEIEVPVESVYKFTINPRNTPLWIEEIMHEEVEGKSIGTDTKYRNIDRNGKWTRYIVTKFIPDEVFELRQLNGNYHVRYSYRKLSESKTDLTYFEWVDAGELASPLEVSTLKRLKGILETHTKV
ncbi:MAG: SRPBCC family protein [Candidatus Micrarchaeota archaeon]|nr:SRPBCC family protein [Candidatus Micrarchaeota archaeon]